MNNQEIYNTLSELEYTFYCKIEESDNEVSQDNLQIMHSKIDELCALWANMAHVEV